jgi:hypothetical protein
MDTELIQSLHSLSTRARRIILDKSNVYHFAHIEESFCLDDFLSLECFGLQSDLIYANEKTINIIVKNLGDAIESNCGNDVDLTKYSKEDVYSFSYTNLQNEGGIHKRYKINSHLPDDISVFKEMWLFVFLENLKTILFNIKYISGLTQQADIKKPDKVEKDLSDFIQNVKNKQEFIQNLKEMFPTEKGKSIKAMIIILQGKGIIEILDRQFTEFYKSLKKDFNRDIGTYPSINDVKVGDFDDTCLDGFRKKLIPLIKTHTIKTQLV